MSLLFFLGFYEVSFEAVFDNLFPSLFPIKLGRTFDHLVSLNID